MYSICLLLTNQLSYTIKTLETSRARLCAGVRVENATRASCSRKSRPWLKCSWPFLNTDITRCHWINVFICIFLISLCTSVNTICRWNCVSRFPSTSITNWWCGGTRCTKKTTKLKKNIQAVFKWPVSSQMCFKSQRFLLPFFFFF